jgi:PAS domain S-box-containing protein
MPQRILIADDSALVAAMLSSALKGAGYETLLAVDGIEATQKAYSEAPDLICLDIYMPRMNGYQVCRLLKNDFAVSDIPVVILTATEDKRTAEFWSRQTGADGFLPKSNDRQALIDTVGALLAGRAPRSAEPGLPPSPEEILSRVSELMDRELYHTTVQTAQLETILSNLQDGILTVDTDLRVLSANPSACRLLGQDEPALLGGPLTGVLGSVAPAASALLGQALQDFSTAPEDMVLDSGTPVELQALSLKDHLGKIVGGICVLSDITRRKQIEALNVQLQDLDKAKQDLTHMIVHDLRTPMTSLISGLQTVPLLGEMNPDQTEFLDMALQGSQTLLGMVNDLLDISKMEDGSMNLERTEVMVAPLIEQAFAQVRSLATSKGITLATKLDDQLVLPSADEEKLRRVLINLLGNALKFTPQGGTVTVLVTLELSGLRFAVKDTGEGIPKEAFEKIFEKFGQVEGRKSGRKNSTGLGLTFCKMAVEAHGGMIWVESELGQGSTFFFTVPQP